MKFNVTKLLSLLVVLVMVLSVTACAAPSAADNNTPVESSSEVPEEQPISDDVEGKRIVFLAKKMSSTFWTDMEDGIKRKCEEYGWTVETLCPIVADSNEEQIELLEQSLIEPPDAYIIGPADSLGIVPAIQQINDAGVPIIVVDTAITDPSAQFECFVGAQFEYIANECGKAMCDILGGNGNILILDGTTGAQTTIDINNGFNTALASCPGITVLDTQPANYVRQDALTVTQNLLQKYPEVDAILAANLEMAMGAIVACEQAGRTSIKVGTINMSNEAAQAMIDGRLAFTADDRSDLVGEAAVERCMDYFSGIELPENSDIACTIVTSDNLGELGYLEKYGMN